VNLAEEQRAADYRAEQAHLARLRVARCAGLHGDPSARAALTANWAPFLMVDAIVEDDDCLTDGCGPFGPQTN
jgi:hypothetical protein